MAVHPGSIWLDTNWTRLPRGIWVAANQGGIHADVHVIELSQYVGAESPQTDTIRNNADGDVFLPASMHERDAIGDRLSVS